MSWTWQRAAVGAVVCVLCAACGGLVGETAGGGSPPSTAHADGGFASAGLGGAGGAEDSPTTAGGSGGASSAGGAGGVGGVGGAEPVACPYPDPTFDAVDSCDVWAAGCPWTTEGTMPTAVLETGDDGIIRCLYGSPTGPYETCQLNHAETAWLCFRW